MMFTDLCAKYYLVRGNEHELKGNIIFVFDAQDNDAAQLMASVNATKIDWKQVSSLLQSGESTIQFSAGVLFSLEKMAAA
ncbi:hypothetical protein [Vibrio hyugaensis]|uniref:hypothetical protein n=1 Tax=Vibrio hyugaensis TaxID=1534743 RepID=UPI003DA0401D